MMTSKWISNNGYFHLLVDKIENQKGFKLCYEAILIIVKKCNDHNLFRRIYDRHSGLFKQTERHYRYQTPPQVLLDNACLGNGNYSIVEFLYSQKFHFTNESLINSATVGDLKKFCLFLPVFNLNTPILQEKIFNEILRNGHFDILRYLMEKHHVLPRNFTGASQFPDIMWYLVNSGHFDCDSSQFKESLSECVSKNPSVFKTWVQECSEEFQIDLSLEIAISNENIEILDYFYKKQPSLFREDSLIFGIFKSIYHYKLKSFQFLMEKLILLYNDIDSVPVIEMRTAHFKSLCMNGSNEMLQCVMGYKMFNFNILEVEENFYFNLVSCFKCKNLENFQYLCKRFYDFIQKESVSNLFCFSKQSLGTIDSLDYLLVLEQYEIPINYHSLLHYCITVGSLQLPVLKHLLKTNTKLFDIITFGQLRIVMKLADHTITELILENVEMIDSQYSSNVNFCGSIEVLEYLLEKQLTPDNPNINYQSDTSTLILKCNKGGELKVKLLLPPLTCNRDPKHAIDIVLKSGLNPDICLDIPYLLHFVKTKQWDVIKQISDQFSTLPRTLKPITEFILQQVRPDKLYHCIDLYNISNNQLEILENSGILDGIEYLNVGVEKLYNIKSLKYFYYNHPNLFNKCIANDILLNPKLKLDNEECIQFLIHKGIKIGLNQMKQIVVRAIQLNNIHRADKWSFIKDPYYKELLELAYREIYNLKQFSFYGIENKLVRTFPVLWKLIRPPKDELLPTHAFITIEDNLIPFLTNNIPKQPDNPLLALKMSELVDRPLLDREILFIFLKQLLNTLLGRTDIMSKGYTFTDDKWLNFDEIPQMKVNVNLKLRIFDVTDYRNQKHYIQQLGYAFISDIEKAALNFKPEVTTTQIKIYFSEVDLKIISNKNTELYFRNYNFCKSVWSSIFFNAFNNLKSKLN
ncbi:hypothetical protein DLAC_11670 [Tieghemostelium lacteum]|uniref:Ankyrin repeat-containing protein n=1 Tax=Tieghemostelium lacteum TaxID=361077 RepID=A0A151ZDS7_TIELA|nr:hypothetical protein DLAC_11670 [Tieghemostelium lacteum]|eukprot:KYQ92060.1 hypothetical protein DLAC_11670 [Tieghemostelium lacteum]